MAGRPIGNFPPPLIKRVWHTWLHVGHPARPVVFANGAKVGDWLAALDDFRNWLIREAA
jgi:hypothetical protein